MNFQVLLSKFKKWVILGGLFVCFSLVGGLNGFLFKLSFAVTYNFARVCKVNEFLLVNSCQIVLSFNGFPSQRQYSYIRRCRLWVSKPCLLSGDEMTCLNYFNCCILTGFLFCSESFFGCFCTYNIVLIVSECFSFFKQVSRSDYYWTKIRIFLFCWTIWFLNYFDAKKRRLVSFQGSIIKCLSWCASLHDLG